MLSNTFVYRVATILTERTCVLSSTPYKCLLANLPYVLFIRRAKSIFVITSRRIFTFFYLEINRKIELRFLELMSDNYIHFCTVLDS